MERFACSALCNSIRDFPGTNDLPRIRLVVTSVRVNVVRARASSAINTDPDVLKRGAILRSLNSMACAARMVKSVPVRVVFE